MSPTMDDVARRAGVSKSTVSMALRDKPGVSDALKARIVRAAAELGYEPSGRGRGAREGEAERAPLAFTIIYHTIQPLDEPGGVTLGYLNGVRAFARERGIHLTILTDHARQDLPSISLPLLEDDVQPDGLIIMGTPVTRKSPFIPWAVERGIPIVALSRDWPGGPVSTVSQDHEEQARIAMEHLIALGHRRIGFVARTANLDFEWYGVRVGCHRRALEQAGLPYDEGLVAVDEDGRVAAKALLARHPEVTAIMGIYDRVAIDAMRGLRELGLRVPEDISVIGLDNANPSPEGFPALTTVGFSHDHLGYLGAELLWRELQDPEIEHAHIILHSHLVERSSCARREER